MQYIPTRFHGAADYMIAVTLVLAVHPLGYAGGGPQTWLTIIVALVIAANALLTDFEWGLAKRLPVPIHMAIDLLLGAAMLASPWMLGFRESVWAPHVAAGALLIVASLTTQPRAYGLEHPAFVHAGGSSS